MDFQQRQSIVDRLCASIHGVFEYKDRIYHLGNPPLIEKVRANLIYDRTLNESDCIRASELDILIWDDRHKYWCADREQEMNNIISNIDDIKVKLYNSFFQSNERKLHRDLLSRARTRLDELYAERHRFDHLTAESVANTARFSHIMSKSIYCGERNLNNPKQHLIKLALKTYSDNRLSEGQIRELARTEPWSSIWISADKSTSIFGVPAAQLNDEQKSLITWSSLYTNVRANTDINDEVINDDDCFDGWLIVKNRERKGKQIEDEINSKISPKMAGAEHIFIMCDTNEDARKIDSVNDVKAKILKRQLFSEIDQHGTIKDQHTSIGQNKIREQWHAQQREHAQRINNG